MNFKCRSCDAVMVFDPDRQKLLCPFCDSVDTEEKRGDASMTVCPSCGGELDPGQFTSASKCPYCGNYIIYDERVIGAFEPSRIMPFKISKKKAVEAMEKEFKSRIFTPKDFLTEKTLVNMEGYYVPFFVYDYTLKGEYDGEGTKVRTWRSGNYDYTETSHYRLIREVDAVYDDVPADASIAMPDDLMDLMEPYDYKLMTSFDPKYMSGFMGEVYNMPAEEVEPRARAKAVNSMSGILKGSVSGYALRAAQKDVITSTLIETAFSLLPVWKYTYRHGDKDYDFYVNGQSGKVVGTTPVSKKKVFWYGLFCSALWVTLLELIFGLIF